MNHMDKQAARAALAWYLDHGVDEILEDEPINRMGLPAQANENVSHNLKLLDIKMGGMDAQGRDMSVGSSLAVSAPQPGAMMGTPNARAEAIRLAKAADTLKDLQEAVAKFDGLAIKKTATNMVFSDGNPEARVMLVGEAPGADEDRQGKPFVGVSGQLLDRIFACIDLDRTADKAEKALYISNILNWRPPGNRTPNPAEVEVSLPFIEKHIMLIKPKVLVFCGGVSAKGLLGRQDSVGKLRKVFHEYKPLTHELGYDGPPIPALVTYHPAYLLRTPLQKKAVWQDMLRLRAHLGV